MGSFEKWADRLNKLNERFSAEQPKKEEAEEASKKEDAKKASKKEQATSMDGLELLERISEIENEIDALKSQIGDLAKSIDKTRAAYAKKEDLKVYVTKKTFEAYKEEQEKTLGKFMESLENLGNFVNNVDADE